MHQKSKEITNGILKTTNISISIVGQKNMNLISMTFMAQKIP